MDFKFKKQLFNISSTRTSLWFGSDGCRIYTYRQYFYPFFYSLSLFSCASIATIDSTNWLAFFLLVQGQGSEYGSLRSIPTLPTNVTEKDSKQHEDRAHVEEYIITQSKNGARDDIVNVQETSSSVDIASSSAGEIKISLTCNTDSSNFHMPSLDTIYKMVEDRCLRSYKFLPPNFSLRHLMNEICECVLDLGTEPSSINHGSYVKINPTIESLKRPGLQNVNLHPSSGLPNVAVPNNGAYLNENACGNDKTGRAKKAMQSAVGGVSNNMPECSMALWQSNLALCDVRPTHDINDISKGEERVRISVVNEISSEKYPPSFSYIPQNVVFQNAHVDFALARIGDEDYCSDCFGDCLSAPVSCPCARETGGEYAYTHDGLVKKQFLDECISMNRNPEKHHHFYCKDCPLERPKNEANKRGACKGHLVRRFVKECWSKCGCNKQCGNRVVQRGITWNLQVNFALNIRIGPAVRFYFSCPFTFGWVTLWMGIWEHILRVPTVSS